MKLFFFFVFITAAILSAAGIDNAIVSTAGCASGIAFSAIVIYQMYKAWTTL